MGAPVGPCAHRQRTAAGLSLGYRLRHLTFTDGNQIALLQSGAGFYPALITAIDGSYNFTATEVGNGSAGLVFDVDAAEQTFLNNTIFNVLASLGGAGNVRMALESTINSAEGGPESFTIINLHAPNVPEPATWAMMLLGFGGIGMAMRRNRRRSSTLMQVA